MYIALTGSENSNVYIYHSFARKMASPHLVFIKNSENITHF